MVIQTWQRTATGLAVAALCAFAYWLSFEVMARLPSSLEYAPGDETARLKRNLHSPLAAFNRLHKGVGGGAWWTLLADSFAIGMLLLGISGIWMWARGRSAKEMRGRLAERTGGCMVKPEEGGVQAPRTQHATSRHLRSPSTACGSGNRWRSGRIRQ